MLFGCRSMVRPLWVVVGCLVLFGCGDPEPSCRTSSDCSDSQICTNNQCVAAEGGSGKETVAGEGSVDVGGEASSSEAIIDTSEFQREANGAEASKESGQDTLPEAEEPSADSGNNETTSDNGVSDDSETSGGDAGSSDGSKADSDEGGAGESLLPDNSLSEGNPADGGESFNGEGSPEAVLEVVPETVAEVVPEQTGKPAGSVCKPGSTGLQGDCDPGLLCLNTGSQTYCFQDCTSQVSVCSNNTNRTSCVPATSTRSVCIERKTGGKEGDACGFMAKSLVLCGQGLACDPKSLKCSKIVEKNAFTRCGGALERCKTNHVCVSFSDTNPLNAYCLPVCDLKNPKCPTKAPSQSICTALNDGSGACIPGALGRGAVCSEIDGSVETLDSRKLCNTSQSCLGLKGSRPICVDLWAGNCATPGKICSTGYRCVEIQLAGTKVTFGSCYRDCRSTVGGTKNCSSAQECRKDLKDVCLGKQLVGPVDFGGVCSLNPAKASTEACKTGLQCIVPPGAAKGFCSRDCSGAGTACPSVTQGASTFPSKCVSDTSATKICAFGCSTAQPNCPKGLTCDTAQQLCLAP